MPALIGSAAGRPDFDAMRAATTRYSTRCRSRKAAAISIIRNGLRPWPNIHAAAAAPRGAPAVEPIAMSGKSRSPSGRV